MKQFWPRLTPSFRAWAEEDEIDVEDLPIWDPRKPKRGMDTTKLDGRDHVTTWSESNKGKNFGLYVTIVPGSSFWETSNYPCLKLNGSNWTVISLTGSTFGTVHFQKKIFKEYLKKKCSRLLIFGNQIWKTVVNLSWLFCQ